MGSFRAMGTEVTVLAPHESERGEALPADPGRIRNKLQTQGLCHLPRQLLAQALPHHRMGG